MILEFLQELEFIKTNANYNIIVLLNKSMFISIYMDNFLVIGKDLSIMNSFKYKLLKYFCITDFRSIAHNLSRSCTHIFYNLSILCKSQFYSYYGNCTIFQIYMQYTILRFYLYERSNEIFEVY